MTVDCERIIIVSYCLKKNRHHGVTCEVIYREHDREDRDFAAPSISVARLLIWNKHGSNLPKNVLVHLGV